MKRPFNPDKEVCDYCNHIMHAHIQVLRENKDERTWYWDYPAVAAVCHNDTCMAKRSSFSHYPSGGKWHGVLRAKLEEIAPIGQRLVGNCAEQHAANNYMNQLTEDDLGELYFSIARRPRTKEEIPYCNNCKRTFPNIH